MNHRTHRWIERKREKGKKEKKEEEEESSIRRCDKKRLVTGLTRAVAQSFCLICLIEQNGGIGGSGTKIGE